MSDSAVSAVFLAVSIGLDVLNESTAEHGDRYAVDFGDSALLREISDDVLSHHSRPIHREIGRLGSFDRQFEREKSRSLR